MVYNCLSGQYDDLGISCTMLNWVAHHPHLNGWYGRRASGTPTASPPATQSQLGRLDVTGPPVRQNIIAVVR